jgi:hypothetical protein
MTPSTMDQVKVKFRYFGMKTNSTAETTASLIRDPLQNEAKTVNKFPTCKKSIQI